MDQLPTREEILSRLENLDKRIEELVQVKKKEIESLGFTLSLDYLVGYKFVSKVVEMYDEKQYLEINLDKPTLMMELSKKIIKESKTHKIPLLVGYLTNENIQNELKRLEDGKE